MTWLKLDITKAEEFSPYFIKLRNPGAINKNSCCINTFIHVWVLMVVMVETAGGHELPMPQHIFSSLSLNSTHMSI